MSTVRFTKLVAAAGRPETALVFENPQENPALNRAAREQRVLTVLRENIGAKAARGQVGLVPGRNTTYLVFPRSLKAFEGQTVIGIKFDLLQEEQGLRPKHKPPKPVPPVREKPRTRFRVVIESVARIETEHVIEARNKSAAAKAALQQAETQAPDFASASIHRKIVKIEKIR